MEILYRNQRQLGRISTISWYPNLVRNINTNLNKSFLTYLTEHMISSFNFSLVNENEVNKFYSLCAQKHHRGMTEYQLNSFEFLPPALIRPLTIIINQSLITGIFLKQQKIAKVIPLHKKDDKLIIDNYRRVSLLPSISQSFEKVAYNQLYAYFTTNKHVLWRAIRISRKTFHRIV